VDPIVWADFPNIRCRVFNIHQSPSFLPVEDYGSGIDSKIIDDIFEPFVTTKDATVGTGHSSREKYFPGYVRVYVR